MFRGLASCFSNRQLFVSLEKVCSVMPSGDSLRHESPGGIGMIAIHLKEIPLQATLGRECNIGVKNCGPDNLPTPDCLHVTWNERHATRLHT